MEKITKEDICAAFDRLKITGKRAVVHSSLGSFGCVEGGAGAVLEAITESFRTVLMPAFCYDYAVTPPPEDRPAQNGLNYDSCSMPGKKATPFMVELARIEPRMGIISCKFLSLPLTKRSGHGWNSWAAAGDLSEYLIKDHSWERPNLPLERLIGLDGQIVLLGVNLSSCSAIHMAEELADRKPFVRWMMDRDGIIKRIRVAGCGKGFDNLMPYCITLFLETYVGKCRILTSPIGPFVKYVAALIMSNPELTRCSSNCLRCEDAIKGGPVI